MNRRSAKKCGHCGYMWFILIQCEGKMRCMICVAAILLSYDGCSICGNQGKRLQYKDKGSLCGNCIAAAMSVDEEEVRRTINSEEDINPISSNHGIYHIGSDAWIENNENHDKVLQAWAMKKVEAK